MSTFVEALAEALRRAGEYNRLVELRPAAVLWPDERREWEPLVPLLRQELPLLSLGPYDPEAGTGPALWLRCMIARTLPEPSLPGGTPIVYLPGHSARELRAMDNCPRGLEALTELQYRGETWARPDGNDWSPPTFLEDSDVGLGVELRGDDATREACRAALPRLAHLSVEELTDNAPWKVRDFQALLLPESPAGAVSIEALIAGGESERVEFKSTAFYDVKGKGARNKEMTGVIVCAIAGFLNGDGGTLLIGVDDDGSVLGLDHDWKALQPVERTRDRYQLKLRDRVSTELGHVAGAYVSFGFHRIGEAEVCVVAVAPANAPVFRKIDGGMEEFHVRQGNRRLNLKMSDAVSYIRGHWPAGGAQ
ncbi:MAG: putative DNA binding domain-containing protein [Dehalococcoidia bacterium]|nr:putative DNA binding domain-containing protein [Dehalococcoidia bacterium]